MVLGQQEALVETADELVDVPAHEHAGARRVRGHVLHGPEVEARGPAGHDVVGAALDRRDACSGDGEAPRDELRDRELDEALRGLAVGVEEQDQVAGGFARPRVATVSGPAASDHMRAARARDLARPVGRAAVGDHDLDGTQALPVQTVEQPG